MACQVNPLARRGHLSTDPIKPLRRHRYLVISAPMDGERIDSAIKRIEAAMQRIEAVRDTAGGGGLKAANGSARVIGLVNTHEKLREQVAETLRELDDVLAKLEE